MIEIAQDREQFEDVVQDAKKLAAQLSAEQQKEPQIIWQEIPEDREQFLQDLHLKERKKLAVKHDLIFIGDFHDGYAKVIKQDGTIHYMDDKGKFAYGPVEMGYKFKEEKAVVKKEGDGRYLINNKFEDLQGPALSIEEFASEWTPYPNTFFAGEYGPDKITHGPRRINGENYVVTPTGIWVGPFDKGSIGHFDSEGMARGTRGDSVYYIFIDGTVIGEKEPFTGFKNSQ